MPTNTHDDNNTPMASNFIHRIIDKDLEEGVNNSVHTRFPPEPNGYLHIGSAYAININYGAAQKYDGKFNLRFDDTNPTREDMEYVQSIIDDIKWLGADWEDRLFYASDYFDQCYEYAIKLIKEGKAFVCDLSKEEMREYRGTLTEPGKDSPYRNRSIEENLELFEKMKNGEFKEGSRVLRAKIDMSSPNMNMRDPVIYRIQFEHHYRTGDKWCIYPMYDYAHPIQDAIEGITHSLCSDEFKDHRPLYEWVIDEIGFEKPPKQREFGRMGVTGTVMSKRYLRELVEGAYVNGWDDPRMPTLQGLRRRGYSPEALRTFLNEVGVSKSNSTVDMAMLEHFVRDDLKLRVPRVMSVLNPLKVVITNYPEGETEWLEADNNPENPEMGSRQIPFSRVVYIEREDFMEEPPKKYKRLSPGVEVRLRHAYFIKCEEVIRDEETGKILELRCTYDPETKSGTGFTARKPKGTIHWVSADHAVKAEVRLYDRLLMDEENEVDDWKENLNPDSLKVLKTAFVEPQLKDVEPGSSYQFLRHGYFCIDAKDSSKDSLVINRIVSLKDSWKKKK
ncbi:MAG: glutamine--tRNA ligase/YqeY domain fusion protein [Maledivibacter sp.]|jgi:glutaminyl-tRNA synthetase|nr:glutamine--tRNA ligase/YqeY domain fusion protein [Maledivibacter sp.]